MKLIIFFSLLLSVSTLSAQVQFTGKVTDNKNAVQTAVYIVEADEEVQTDVRRNFYVSIRKYRYLSYQY